MKSLFPSLSFWDARQQDQRIFDIILKLRAPAAHRIFNMPSWGASLAPTFKVPLTSIILALSHVFSSDSSSSVFASSLPKKRLLFYYFLSRSIILFVFTKNGILDLLLVLVRKGRLCGLDIWPYRNMIWLKVQQTDQHPHHQDYLGLPHLIRLKTRDVPASQTRWARQTSTLMCEVWFDWLTWPGHVKDWYFSSESQTKFVTLLLIM